MAFKEVSLALAVSSSTTDVGEIVVRDDEKYTTGEWFDMMMEHYPRMEFLNLEAEMKFAPNADEDEKQSYLGFRFFGIVDPDGWRNRGYSFSTKITAQQLEDATCQSSSEQSGRSFHGHQLPNQHYKFLLQKGPT
jgi:hypothetical protein